MADPDEPGRRRPTLTREKILAGAVAFADEHGVEALSMRKLAGALGFEVMSLYNHVANKADILGGVVDLVIVDVVLPPAEVDWRTSIHQMVGQAHRALLQHPWVTLLWYTTPPGAARLRYLEALLEILRGRAGFSSEVTRHGFHAVNRHLLGFAAEEVDVHVGDDDLSGTVAGFLELISEGQYPRLVEHANHRIAHLADDDDFLVGLDLILDGLEQANSQRREP